MAAGFCFFTWRPVNDGLYSRLDQLAHSAEPDLLHAGGKNEQQSTDAERCGAKDQFFPQFAVTHQYEDGK